MLLTNEVAAPTEYLNLLRGIILDALSEKATTRDLRQVLCRCYWEEMQLGTALAAFAAHLLDIDFPSISPKQLPNGAALIEWAGHWRKGSLPIPSFSAELGMLWGVLGILQEDRGLYTALLKFANWQLNTLDHQLLPFPGLWSHADDFSMAELLANNALLFSLAGAITDDERFQKAAAAQKKALKGLEVSPFMRALIKYLETKTVMRATYPFSRFSEEVTLGLVKWTQPTFSTMFTLSGCNSGMGAFHKTEVACLNFGPQVAPFDDSSGFGIDRPCSMTEKVFKDLLWEKSRTGVFMKGWTKAHALNLWIEAALTVEGKELKIDIQCQEKERAPFYFLFFLRGKKIAIGQRVVQSASLDRYCGDVVEIILIGELEQIQINALQEGKMEIIPLAGENNFWGADFLLAYEIDPERNKYQWIVK